MAEKLLIKGDTNPFNEKFIWDPIDPWLGTYPKWDWIPLTIKKSKEQFHEPKDQNEGFYWLYPCIQEPNAPVQVSFVGGPSFPVLIKAFDHWNPQHIDEKNSCLTYNNKSLSKRVNLLYIENPIGAGLSHLNGNISSVEEDLESMLEFFKKFLEIFPKFQEKKWFFHGDGYGGRQIPSISQHQVENLKIKVEGIVQINPFMDPEQWEINSKLEMLNDYRVWQSCLHSCFSSCIMHSLEKMWRKNIIGLSIFEASHFIPFVWMMRRKRGLDCWAINPNNLAKNNTPVSEIFFPSKIKYFIKCKSFLEKIEAKREISTISSLILEKDSKYSSVPAISKLLQNETNILIICGEADCVNPASIVEKVITKVEWDGQADFVLKPWCNGKGYIYKEAKGLKFIRKFGLGHVAMIDDPEYYKESLEIFLTDNGVIDKSVFKFLLI